MFLTRVLTSQCNQKSELGTFLFLQEITQALDIAFSHSDKLMSEGCSEKWEAQKTREKVIAQTIKFGVKNPVESKDTYTERCYSGDYHKWYNWWSKYLTSLSVEEQNKITILYLTGGDLSTWCPPHDRDYEARQTEEFIQNFFDETKKYD